MTGPIGAGRNYSDVEQVSCNLSDLPYVYKVLKKRDGHLHEKIPLITEEEKIEKLNELNKNKPDCSRLGYAQAIGIGAAKGFGIKPEPDFSSNVPKASTLAAGLITGYGYAKYAAQVQLGIQGARTAYEEHEQRCNMHVACEHDIRRAAKTKIAEVKFKPSAAALNPNDASKHSRRPIPELKKPTLQRATGNPNQVQERIGNLEQRIPPQSQTNNLQKRPLPEPKKPAIQPTQGNTNQVQGETEGQERIIHPQSEQQPPSSTSASPTPNVSSDLNLIRPKQVTVSIENPLSESISTKIDIAPFNPTASTISTTANLTDHVATSFVLNPNRPQDASMNLSFSHSGFGVGVDIPTKPQYASMNFSYSQNGYGVTAGIPKHGTMQVGGSIPDVGSMSANVSFRKPLRTQIKAEAPIPGTPFIVGAKFKLGKIQNAKAEFGISTFGLNNIIPLIPDKIKILSINCKKIRHKIKALFGYKKRDHLSQKEIKQHAEEHRLLMAKFQEHEAKIKQAIEAQIKSMVQDAVNAVDANYRPFLERELQNLTESLNEFFHEFSSNMDGGPVGHLNELAWNEPAWQNFFQARTELADSFDQLIHFTEQLDRTFEELGRSMENCLQAASLLSEQYLAAERTFRETEEITHALTARREQVRAYLQDNIPQEVLQRLNDHFSPHN